MAYQGVVEQVLEGRTIFERLARETKFPEPILKRGVFRQSLAGRVPSSYRETCASKEDWLGVAHPVSWTGRRLS